MGCKGVARLAVTLAPTPLEKRLASTDFQTMIQGTEATTVTSILAVVAMGAHKRMRRQKEKAVTG